MAGRNNRKSQFSLSGRRPAGVIDERKFFLIVTEGKTEAQYFDHFRSTTGPRIMSHDGSVSKIRLVEAAIELRAKVISDKSYNEEVDETWVVFDRDIDIRKPNDKETLNEALALAERENINVAYSNDAFELWFLLHFQAVSGEMHRDVVCDKLKTHIGGSYEHGDDIFDKIDAFYPEALKRAQQMLRAAEGVRPVDANPSTTVHLLTEKLRKNMD